MECFQQIFRCLKAPFVRNQGKIIEIGPPTNFRKEELPACFSDAESVLSPSENATERANLTSQPQYVDFSEQPRNNDGEGRDDNRDDRLSAVCQGEGSKPCQKDERPPLQARLRDRMKCSRWFKSTPSTDSENEVFGEDGLFTTAEDKPKNV
ncbi:uncharacterized protein N7473_004920 [Penicillium subrubescens]|uniref:Uncharacterized protein n=1 Tax=Penicillium subrubescens TaxID=1316194 RepID=A0A1Q5T9R4_9EURO|nr:uncharacterized protein N7473_004920 [Penicillium subrubescens]KAJ5900850.1 hypothetical protein N7473_004920 [Penicillium subrubescens]OKO96921.1 hypothetical protein PENSUB_10475 [Penicillium subrubescens]